MGGLTGRIGQGATVITTLELPPGPELELAPTLLHIATEILVLGNLRKLTAASNNVRISMVVLKFRSIKSFSNYHLYLYLADRCPTTRRLD